MPDHHPFVGVWKMNVQGSSFDTDHRPSEGMMRFERDFDGYVMRAEGVLEGKHIEEQPIRFILDGKEHPVPGTPKITATSTRPNPNTISGGAARCFRGGRGQLCHIRGWSNAYHVGGRHGCPAATVSH